MVEENNLWQQNLSDIQLQWRDRWRVIISIVQLLYKKALLQWVTCGPILKNFPFEDSEENQHLDSQF